MPNRTWIRVMFRLPVCSGHCLGPMRPTGFSDCPRRGHCFCVSGRVIRPLGFLWCFWVTVIQTTVGCLDVNTVVVLLGWKSLWTTFRGGPDRSRMCPRRVLMCNKLGHLGNFWKSLHICGHRLIWYILTPDAKSNLCCLIMCDELSEVNFEARIP